MNLKEFFIKRKIFILGISLLILIGGGFFYYWQFYETPPEKWDEAKYSKPEDYEVIETSEGLIVENKKAGLSFKVPEGWRVEKGKYRTALVLYSPDAEEKSFLMKKGCKIYTELSYIKTNLETIEQKLRERHKTRGYIDEYEIFHISNHKALRNITGILNLDQHYVGVDIPIKSIFKSKLCSLSVHSNFQDKERCTQEFEQFLKTVSIK